MDTSLWVCRMDKGVAGGVAINGLVATVATARRMDVRAEGIGRRWVWRSSSSPSCSTTARTQRAHEDGAERGLGVDGRIVGRDDADTAGPQLAKKAGKVPRCAGQIVYVADDQYVDLSDLAAFNNCCSPGRRMVAPDAWWSVQWRRICQPGREATCDFKNSSS